MDSIGARIRTEREAQDIGRGDLAKAAGIAKTTLSDLELGRSRSTTVLHKIAKALRVRAEWLETGKGPKHLEPDAASQPLRLDPVILAESIAALRQVAQRNGWDYDPERDAESTCYAYEMWQLLPSRPTTADVIDFGAKIAERLRQNQGGNDGRGESRSRPGAGPDDRIRIEETAGKAGIKGGAR